MNILIQILFKYKIMMLHVYKFDFHVYPNFYSHSQLVHKGRDVTKVCKTRDVKHLLHCYKGLFLHLKRLHHMLRG